MRVKGRRSRRDAAGALDACRAGPVPSMIASGAMREPTGRREHCVRGRRIAGHSEPPHNRVSIVDGEFWCLRPGILSARARQAKGRAQNEALAEWREASRPVVAARFRALEGPVLKT